MEQAKVIKQTKTRKPKDRSTLPYKVKVNHPLADITHWYRVYRVKGIEFIVLKGKEYAVDITESTEITRARSIRLLRDIETSELQAEIDRRNKQK